MQKILKTLLIIVTIQNAFAQTNFIKDSLDIYINREIKRWNLPGLAIAIIKDGKVIVMKGYGYSDVIKKTPVTENTEFQIASNSKAFTGTSLALLQHYGKLNLDDKVKKYLPYFKMKDNYLTENITIRDALSHRIGYETFQTDFINWASTKNRKQLIENMVNASPKFGFREKYGYCNMGFVTAGEIIPAVTDTTWDDYVKYHYFNPLGMVNTHTNYQTFMSSENASKAYTLLKGALYEIKPSNIDNIGPAGSITSTVNDLSKWVIMQLNDGNFNGKQIVPKSVIEETRKSNMITGDGRGKGNHFRTYGLGWFLKDKFGKKVILHEGGAFGFLSKTVLVPEDNFGFVILTNSDMNSLYEALEGQLIYDLAKQPYTNFSELYYNGFKEGYDQEQNAIKKLKQEVASFKVPENAYKKIEGTYNNTVYGKITITNKNSFAEVKFEFHPQYSAKLYFKNDSTLMIAYNDESGLGVKEVAYFEKDKTIEIKVSEFVDMDTYLFKKL